MRIPVLPLKDLSSISDRSLSTKSEFELQALKSELLKVKRQLEVSEAKRADAEAALKSPSDEFALLHERLIAIESRQMQTNTKLDQINAALSRLNTGVSDIKRSSVDGEAKLAEIGKSIDQWALASSVENETRFQKAVSKWFKWVSKAERESVVFLASAEHLHHELTRVNGADFSPYIVQVCRALEFELASKLFDAYRTVAPRRFEDFEQVVAEAKAKKDFQQFGELISSSYSCTLGATPIYLRKLGGKSWRKSRLMSDFH